MAKIKTSLMVNLSPVSLLVICLPATLVCLGTEPSQEELLTFAQSSIAASPDGSTSLEVPARSLWPGAGLEVVLHLDDPELTESISALAVTGRTSDVQVVVAIRRRGGTLGNQADEEVVGDVDGLGRGSAPDLEGPTERIFSFDLQQRHVTGKRDVWNELEQSVSPLIAVTPEPVSFEAGGLSLELFFEFHTAYVAEVSIGSVDDVRRIGLSPHRSELLFRETGSYDIRVELWQRNRRVSSATANVVVSEEESFGALSSELVADASSLLLWTSGTPMYLLSRDQGAEGQADQVYLEGLARGSAGACQAAYSSLILAEWHLMRAIRLTSELRHGDFLDSSTARKVTEHLVRGEEFSDQTTALGELHPQRIEALNRVLKQASLSWVKIQR